MKLSPDALTLLRLVGPCEWPPPCEAWPCGCLHPLELSPRDRVRFARAITELSRAALVRLDGDALVLADRPGAGGER